MLTVIVAFFYALHIGRKDEQRRRERRSSSGMAFDGKPKGRVG